MSLAAHRPARASISAPIWRRWPACWPGPTSPTSTSTGPGELWIETTGGAIERHDAPALDEATLARLARQIAALSHQGISREHPLLSATLPDGARVQVVAPPATRGPLALAIRKHVSPDLTLDDYVAAGAFAETTGREAAGPLAGRPRACRRSSTAGDIAGMLAAAVKARKNILISGGTSSGKTTFLNALIREIPARGAADPDRGHARAVRRPRQCRRPARGAQRAGRGAR